VDEANPATNHGQDSVVRIGYDEGYNDRQTLVQFDLPSIPDHAFVVSATLELYLIFKEARLVPDDGVVAWADAIEEDWDELSATWSSIPAASHQGDPPHTILQTEHQRWDVTAIARAWARGELENHGILLRVDEASGYSLRSFHARPDARAPKLTLTLGSLDAELNAYRRAVQHLEEVRGTEAAPGWEQAQVDPSGRRLYRPDMPQPAYYDFSVTVPPGNTPAGFIVVATGDHDDPIPHWSYAGDSPTRKLADEAAAGGQTAARFWKLDALAYLAENASNEQVATLSDLPLKVEGLDPTWLDDPPGLTQTFWRPSLAVLDDAAATSLTGTLVISGPGFPASIQLSAWDSWADLKTNYATHYADFIEYKRRKVADLWEAEDQRSSYGIPLFRGDVYDLGLLWMTSTVSLSGVGAGYVQVEEVPRPDLPSLLRVTCVDTVRGEFLPLTATVDYDNGARETVRFLVADPYRIWLPLVTKNYDARLGMGSGPGPGAQLKDTVVILSEWLVGADSDQCWYSQLDPYEAPNTEHCHSGCGNTAWAMLFGWVDNQAENGTPDWIGRWGLYRQNGGRGPDALAPKTWTDPAIQGVKNMIWEIELDTYTFCADLGTGATDLAATDPDSMSDVSDYIQGRSGVWVTDINMLWDFYSEVRNRAIDLIQGDGYVQSPAIIGVGFYAHYPLAYGYRLTPYTLCGKKFSSDEWGCWTVYGHSFLVNEGWAGSSGDWVGGSDIWYAGGVQPYLPWVDDVGFYRASDSRWRFDYNHDGSLDWMTEVGWGGPDDLTPLPWVMDWDGDGPDDVGYYVGSAWITDKDHNSNSDWHTGPFGLEGDRPVVGDFDRDGVMDDWALYHPYNQTWEYDLNHDAFDSYTRGPFGLEGDLPIAGDFDRDGYVDDVALYRPSDQKWYYDYDHDAGTPNETVGPWGLVGDLPFAGDFDRDGRVDDVGVYRPSTKEWYLDINHDGTTDVTWQRGWGHAIPIAGDFDGDGFIDDVGLYRTGALFWVYDIDHNDSFDETVGPWGWSGDLPVLPIVLDYDRDGVMDDLGYHQGFLWRYNTGGDPQHIESRSVGPWWVGYQDLPIAGDFDGDGWADDVGFYVPDSHYWYYDYNHNGRATDESHGPWGYAEDLPFAGDFDCDDLLDDVGVYRPSTGEWFFDFDHDGATNEHVVGPLAGEMRPFAGDLDRDGCVDDVGAFIPATGVWWFDIGHNGTLDGVFGIYGKMTSWPFAGTFDLK
jgi:hypothetical protein